jgi:hypothetical protein
MKAIDIHVHVPAPLDHASTKEKEKMAGYFGAGNMPTTPEDMYNKYRELDILENPMLATIISPAL